MRGLDRREAVGEDAASQQGGQVDEAVVVQRQDVREVVAAEELVDEIGRLVALREARCGEGGRELLLGQWPLLGEEADERGGDGVGGGVQGQVVDGHGGHGTPCARERPEGPAQRSAGCRPAAAATRRMPSARPATCGGSSIE